MCRHGNATAGYAAVVETAKAKKSAQAFDTPTFRERACRSPALSVRGSRGAR